MPFTFSHPLFAVPLRRIAPKWLSVTGLVLGSMAPDMEYFMAMEPYRSIGHTLSGFILLGVPLSIAIAYAFHIIIKPVLPQFMLQQGGADRFVQDMLNGQRRWQLRTGREWIVFIGSLFIGFLTHLFMDSWTHSSGLFVKLFPVLYKRIAGEGIYHLLQYATSLIGLLVPAVLLLYRYQRWRRSVHLPASKRAGNTGPNLLLWGVAAAVALIMVAFKMAGSYGQPELGSWIVAPLSSALFGVFVASLLFAAFRRKREGRTVILLAATVFIMIGYNTSQLQILSLLHDMNRTITLEQFQRIHQLVWVAFCIAWAALVTIVCRIAGGEE